MADSKLSDLTADASPSSDDLIYTVHDPSGTPADRKVTLANLASALASMSGLTGAFAPLPSRTSFTPTWTSTGDAPSIGNGTLSGEYAELGGGLMWIRIFLQVGTTTDVGTGDWSFALPSGFTLAPGNQVMSGYADDDSASQRAAVFGQLNSLVAGKVNRVYRDGTSALNSTTPWAWAASDSVTLEGVVAYG